MKKEEKIYFSFVALGLLVVLFIVSIRPRPQQEVEEIPIEDVEFDEEHKDFLDSVLREDNRLYDSLINDSESENYRSQYSQSTKKVTMTKYNPVVEQCDSDPLVTADNSKICLDKLNKGKLKWLAVSRDLRKDFRYGDVVELICHHDPSVNGEYEIHDTMNPRWRNRIDLLSPIGDERGKWNNVIIKKKKRGN